MYVCMMCACVYVCLYVSVHTSCCWIFLRILCECLVAIARLSKICERSQIGSSDALRGHPTTYAEEHTYTHMHTDTHACVAVLKHPHYIGQVDSEHDDTMFT